MGLLEDGETFLCDVFNTSEDVTVTYIASPYSTPANTISDVKATVGFVPSELDDDQFSQLRSNQRDFIIAASQLVVSSNPIQPKGGDLVEETRNGIVYRYQVTDELGEGAWRWHGATYKAYRIHTILVEEEAAP